MVKTKIPNDFLESKIHGACFYCEATANKTPAKLRLYYKYRNSITLSTPFTRKITYQDIDSRFQEEFIMCDYCRPHWQNTPESKLSKKFYRVFYMENRYSDPEQKAKLKERNARAWQQRKGDSDVAITEEPELI